MTANTPSLKVRCFIGLGSNLEDPVSQVKQALQELAELPDSRFIKASSLYSSAPVGPQDQSDFVNAVAEMETTLEAHALLDQLQSLEQKHQRVRERHWGPRTLDLDLLLYGTEQINSERLTVPHAFMQERSFVLYPLAEIAADTEIPNIGSLSQLLVACPMGTLAKI
ncbi:2-amino-4-hydroxy-6-hydroxymethyldihydropteridine diphosphokinase [Neptuniibacter sp.]|uniref:2-amino-4-hydroxy-6- hydroxymethyldihydropteridine diphosphokinase n=1 Tax=Neptuniibacter sp. TaxID=1962643 RepID=UPI00260EAC6F|nr:2-amino-4-hydroxy-6-hydroxymethyldihydropteridine diphosphokinase [Neptuniibacter sp.]MCP4597716.1 2-amino-4-hydroxy-6-hydroxymethyldihydropteridine diphosphokinase [Neptuniibacter sp.]